MMEPCGMLLLLGLMVLGLTVSIVPEAPTECSLILNGSQAQGKVRLRLSTQPESAYS